MGSQLMKSSIMEQLKEKMVKLGIPVDNLNTILSFLSPETCDAAGMYNGNSILSELNNFLLISHSRLRARIGAL